MRMALSRSVGKATIFRASATSAPIAYTSLMELAAAMAPKVYGSSTIGGKKSTVCTIAWLSLMR